jgi:predicted transcriptional regulator
MQKTEAKNIPGLTSYEFIPPSKKAVKKRLQALARQVTPDQRKYVVEPAMRGKKRTPEEEMQFRAWLANQ